MNLNIVAIIPARGGSKGIPKKNIVNIAGKPLIAYSISVASESKYIDKVVVSTDDENIAEIAQNLGVEVIIRPKELAEDNTPDLPVFQHAVETLIEKEKYKPDIVINLRPTCPLRNIDDIDNAVSKLIETKCDSVRTVVKVEEHPYWMVKFEKDKLFPFLENIDKNKFYQRQLLPDLYIFNGGVDVMRSEIILNENSLYGKDIRGSIMPPDRSIDIDNELDLKIVDFLIKEREGKL
jgi:CMP-N-acetylneuraminic acid synthetase